MILYFNPDCSKCRAADELLTKSSCTFTRRNYLQQPPTVQELRDLLHRLGISAAELVRRSEPLYLAHFATLELKEEDWLAILSQHPILIERPILIDGEKAIIGRPPERVLAMQHGVTRSMPAQGAS